RVVRLHAGDGDVENRITTLLLDDVHRKFNAGEVFVIRINTLDKCVAGESDIDFCRDVLDKILFIYRSCDCVLVEGGKRHQFLFSTRTRDRSLAVSNGTFQESMRGQPHIERAGFGAAIDVLVLDDVARDRTDASLTSARIKWSSTATTRRRLVVDAY